MKQLILSVLLLSIVVMSANAQDNVLTERGTLSNNFLSQSVYQLNTASFWDAASKPPGALSEGMLVFQQVNTSLANFSCSLYADLNNEELYLNTGTYGTAGANWKGWRKFLNSTNFSSYALSLSGGQVNGNIGVSGNVLIGKTTQTNTSYKLDVAGVVRANSIVVNTTGADFVFDDKYKLRPLSELKNYVQSNRHLPEIPSANQMKENGMDVGELNKRLLQKIEELTLYLIKQETRIRKLETQLKSKSK